MQVAWTRDVICDFWKGEKKVTVLWCNGLIQIFAFSALDLAYPLFRIKIL